jgi:hypothetical protein
MINKYFELERLRTYLSNRGLESSIVESIIQKADHEIESVLAQKLEEAMSQAIQAGIDKGSADFINDLRPNPGAFVLETSSGSTDFSEPPFPMLPRLLANAKPMKDGSGVYKVIPVGGRDKNKKPVSANIFDAQKAIQAERAEEAKRQYNSVAPSGSVTFRTATSKQSADTSWVIPAKEKDFTEELTSINSSLQEEMSSLILSVIREYEESF